MRWPWTPRPEPSGVAQRARRAEDLTSQALAEMRALTAELHALGANLNRLQPPEEPDA